MSEEKVIEKASVSSLDEKHTATIAHINMKQQQYESYAKKVLAIKGYDVTKSDIIFKIVNKDPTILQIIKNYEAEELEEVAAASFTTIGKSQLPPGIVIPSPKTAPVSSTSDKKKDFKRADWADLNNIYPATFKYNRRSDKIQGAVSFIFEDANYKYDVMFFPQNPKFPQFIRDFLNNLMPDDSVVNITCESYSAKDGSTKLSWKIKFPDKKSGERVII